jgi:hypothetical protein
VAFGPLGCRQQFPPELLALPNINAAASPDNRRLALVY